MKNSIFIFLITLIISNSKLYSQKFFSVNSDKLKKDIYVSNKTSSLFSEVTFEETSNGYQILSIERGERWFERWGVALNPLGKITKILTLTTVFKKRVNLEKMFVVRLDIKRERYGKYGQLFENKRMDQLNNILLKDVFIWNDAKFRGENAINILGWDGEDTIYDLIIPR